MKTSMIDEVRMEREGREGRKGREGEGVIEIANKISLKPNEMVESSTISPAEATRRGADKDAINAIAVRPPRKGFKFA